MPETLSVVTMAPVVSVTAKQAGSKVYTPQAVDFWCAVVVFDVQPVKDKAAAANAIKDANLRIFIKTSLIALF